MMAESQLPLAVVVNTCTICGISYSTPIWQHHATEFHKMNRSSSKRLSIEAYAKKKRITLAHAKRQIALAVPREVHFDPSKVKAEAKTASQGHVRVDKFISKATIIKKTIQEHSHNNHHGLPGANKYAHHGPCSAPGRNNMFRGKKD